ncbi:hypothetical protein Cni_G02278 [Canna indica]|uniref:CW-type domain-containing protein n=1 Tax=Canna indica TaxID=4628 RepID=A0AAQ3PZX1_9LILI|nr:hypothetical protein Cni_G02278 [Canna indica]
MLSAGRRGDGRKALGFGGGEMEEENELEEGEACSGQEDGPCIDPDALSYIDEKIQDVLGHFQKDFEAGFSAENLGAKFGGYGSFLPTYQRSPSIFCQPRSPQKQPNQNVKKSACSMHTEVTNQNKTVGMSSSIPKGNNISTPLLDNSCKKDMCMNRPNIQEPCSQKTSFNKTTNGTDHKTLKVRIKMGPDNSLARNNAVIYSGLGLDISPSSSFEASPDGSGDISPELPDLPDESPKTIIQVMTCFSPGGFLSPLQDCLLQLIEKDISSIKQCKRGKFYKGRPETSADVADLNIHSREVKGQMEKHSKLGGQKGKPRETKNLGLKNGVILNKEFNIETQEGLELCFNSFDVTQSSISKNVDKIAGQTVGNPVKIGSELLDHPKETKKAFLQDKTISTGSMIDKHSVLVESTISNEPGILGNKITQLKRQLNIQVGMPEKTLEEQNANNQKDDIAHPLREGRIRVEKDFDTTITYSSGDKRRIAQLAETADHVKPSSPVWDKKLQEGQISGKKKKAKVGQTNSKSNGMLLKDNVVEKSSTTRKEKKKNSHAKSNHPVKKSKGLKSHEDLSEPCIRESHGSINLDAKAKNLENGVGSFNHPKVKQKSFKRNHEDPMISTQTFNERSGSKEVENPRASGGFLSEPLSAPLISSASATDATVAPQAPVVIEENWVQCDKCHKWRLLPYGTITAQLPSHWQCKMLDWLPGMNSCHISEEDTTNALNALYLAPAPEQVGSLVGRDTAATSTSVASGMHLVENLELVPDVPSSGNGKFAQKHASVLPNHPSSNKLPNAVKRDDRASDRYRIVNEANQNLSAAMKSSKKDGNGNSSRSTDSNVEKHKPKKIYKHTNHWGYSDGGDHGVKNEKLPKSKSKKVVDQDDLRAAKKLKKESIQYSNNDVVSKVFDKNDIGGCSTNIIANSQPTCNFSSSKDSECDMKGNSSSKIRDEGKLVGNGQRKEHSNASNVEKASNAADHSSKKRKMKERQGSRCNQEALVTSRHVIENGTIGKGSLGEAELVNDKKAELSVSEGKRSKATKPNNRMNKKHMTGMALPDNVEHLPDGMDEAYVVDKEHRSSQSHATSQRDLEFDSSKRKDTIHKQLPVAANSSSSKVSGSHKSRCNLKEVKGSSPVESVSSSPLRIQGMEKQSGKNISERKDGQGWMINRLDKSSTLQENIETNAVSILPKQKRDSDSKNVVESRFAKQESQVAPFRQEKMFNHHALNENDIPELQSGAQKTQLKLEKKQETQSQLMVASPLKERRSDVDMAGAVNVNTSKVVKQHRQRDIHNGLPHSNLRQATPNGLDTSSPIRKENHSVLMKEARDLKHTANRLKNEGQELVSTGLYFEAALKFLRVAALMEPANSDSAKQAEAAKMYFETAKLCEFVAHEYERFKDMAAAALAFKCVEVAYLKAAYCKNPNASRDRHELQAAFQFLPPGESPSSSASDIDNLNNQVMLAKNASAKAVSSPQVAGNHVIAARHHHQVMRLLHYTNDLNCAFEATRKSQISIAAASLNMDKHSVESLCSVREVLDFNFHNVEGLLRLVRLSLESIGR